MDGSALQQMQRRAKNVKYSSFCCKVQVRKWVAPDSEPDLF